VAAGIERKQIVTLNELFELAKTVRGFDAAALTAMEYVLAGTADTAQLSGLRRVRDWLQEVEDRSGNDEELADDVGGALAYVDAAIGRKEEPK
jgi:hypothetical protein